MKIRVKSYEWWKNNIDERWGCPTDSNGCHFNIKMTEFCNMSLTATRMWKNGGITYYGVKDKDSCNWNWSEYFINQADLIGETE